MGQVYSELNDDLGEIASTEPLSVDQAKALMIGAADYAGSRTENIRRPKWNPRDHRRADSTRHRQCNTSTNFDCHFNRFRGLIPNDPVSQRATVEMFERWGIDTTK
ncbi:MAG TPA: hypothetical protein VJU54_06715 [Nitrospiraceae bacterium]|nr:hypothetical protein [Nitrospiraceae bacterium]